MARSTARWQSALPSAAADLDAELDRFANLGIADLRALWREKRGQEPPEALSKDLIARSKVTCRGSAIHAFPAMK
jgi:hypothetical protein